MNSRAPNRMGCPSTVTRASRPCVNFLHCFGVAEATPPRGANRSMPDRGLRGFRIRQGVGLARGFFRLSGLYFGVQDEFDLEPPHLRLGLLELVADHQVHILEKRATGELLDV